MSVSNKTMSTISMDPLPISSRDEIGTGIEWRYGLSISCIMDSTCKAVVHRTMPCLLYRGTPGACIGLPNTREWTRHSSGMASWMSPYPPSGHAQHDDVGGLYGRDPLAGHRPSMHTGYGPVHWWCLLLSSYYGSITRWSECP